MTLHDVAREAGVSYATASRALNGSDRSVRAENLARVRAAATRLGYTPHVSAQAIARGFSNTVALVVGAVDDPYFASIADGVAEGAYAAGLTLTAAVTDRSPDMGLQIVRTLRGRRPQVILIAGSRVDDDGVYAALAEELDQYRRAGGRVALLSRNELDFPTLTVDHHGGAFRLAQALAGLGYRRFAVLHGDDRIRMSHDRGRGFLDGLRQAGIHVEDRHVIATDLNRDGGHRAAAALLRDDTSRYTLPGRAGAPGGAGSPVAAGFPGGGSPDGIGSPGGGSRHRTGSPGGGSPHGTGSPGSGYSNGADFPSGGYSDGAGIPSGGSPNGAGSPSSAGILSGAGISRGTGIPSGTGYPSGLGEPERLGNAGGSAGSAGSAGGVEVIFAVNDVMAIGAMTAIREAGLQPGRDVAVAGFDDIDAARDVTPMLTSVRVPLRELGRRAVELALAGDPAVVEIPVEVVLRNSTPPR
ncbi:DNA-binding transcriptional regulator, LacI/PurR family [Actinoplanes philippinensis]|uniref:DNA-binding transcriptional regulator, LacI/PurR family n=1 Tax=Actinoplanes philippinensis TaxID=35752 RepID=A0A1I2GHI0_9ACTN|nr:DNA-binding transcriptional regulator, LacI/PurR family [Actinoplanes philippinensis]